MSQLDSLLSITRVQSDRQLALLRQKRQFISQLEQQLQELIDYSRSYQQDAVGTDDNLSALLIHRQRFVTHLGVQIDELTHRISLMAEDARKCAVQWQHFEARMKAIESMVEHRVFREHVAKEKLEQEITDELSRSGSKSGFDSEQNKGLDYA